MTAARLPAIFCVLCAAALLAACAGTSASTAANLDASNRLAAAQGSPFRWRSLRINGAEKLTVVLADLPSGATRADVPTRRNILLLIADTEATAGRPPPQIADIKILPDHREVWLLAAPGHNGIAYVVELKPSPQGGTDIEVSGARGYYKD
jgi:hypothetical protein